VVGLATDESLADVKLRGVTKKFGRVVAVNRVTLDISDGEFFAILGPSGCGKTTLLRLIAGLEFPDEGEILIGGRVVNNLHPRDRDVAMVFQNYALYPHMRVFDNIAFPLMVRRRELGLDKEAIRRRVVEVARVLGIEGLLDRYPRELSGGQQQRVALARALVREPKVWLLDEPLSNLDAKLRVQMRAELKSLQRKFGVTTVYVTHDQGEAMSLADRIAVMNEGRVLQVGTPDDLYLKPLDIFVATFIGSPSTNIIPCNVVSVETLELECAGFNLKTGISLDPSILKPGDKVYLGVRPEHVEIRKSQDEGVTLKGKVTIIEPLGSQSIVTLSLGSESIRALTSRDLKVDVGEDVYIRIDVSKTLLYDAKTGKLLL
jgi:multiple sugar transport system ATP-binding protein